MTEQNSVLNHNAVLHQRWLYIDYMSLFWVCYILNSQVICWYIIIS